MKTFSTIIVAALVTASTTSAPITSSYQCPNLTVINEACHKLSEVPLVCINPSESTNECDSIQCNQDYIDSLASCLCRHGTSQLYEKSTGIGLLLQRCGESVLINPYGDPSQYLPDQYTQTPSENLSDKVSKIPIKAIAEDDAEEGDDNGEEGGGGQAEVTTAIAAATTTTTTTFIFLTSSSPTVALEPPTNTPVPNDSYNTSRISVAAVVGIILGLMGFLLAVTLITIIVGSKCTGAGSRDIATPDYHHDNDHSFGFAAGLPMNVTTSSALPRTSTAEESWDKIEYDLPVYSDIMANGSSFAAMKEAGIDTQTIPYSRYASDPNNSSSSSSSNNSGGGDGYPNSPTSNSPASNNPLTPDYDHYHDSNADQETISNNMAHNSGSSGSRGDRAA